MVNVYGARGRCASGLLLLAVVVVLCPGVAAAQGGPVVSAELPSEVQAHLRNLTSALKTARAAGEVLSEAKTLNQIGEVHYLTSDFPECLDDFTKARAAAETAKNAVAQSEALNGMANCVREQGQNDKALELAQQALDVATASGDVRGQAVALNGLGSAKGNLDKNDEAMALHNRALPLAQKAGDVDLQASTLNRIGQVYDHTENLDKALKTYNQALDLWRAAHDARGQGITLGNIGILYAEQGDKLTALDFMKKALPLDKAAGNRASTAKTLLNTGIVYSLLGEKQVALGYYNQALPFLHAMHDVAGESIALLSLGNLDVDLEKSQAGMEAYQRGLDLARATGSQSTEASLLAGMGRLEDRIGEEQKALDDLNQALTIFRSQSSRGGEATVLNTIGTVYDNLGDQKRALDDYTQSLKIQHEIGNTSGEAMALSNIAGIYGTYAHQRNTSDDGHKALDYDQQALALYRGDEDNEGISRTLENMGTVYTQLQDYEKALPALEEALKLRESDSGGGRSGDTGVTLSSIGDVYDAQGQRQKGREYHLQALPLTVAAADPLEEAVVLRSLMLNLRSDEPAMAIFYGKQAVNMAQHVRARIPGNDRTLQTSFLGYMQDYYHDLASLLIAQGRLPEAQQVLDLIKEQEFQDYVRGASPNALSPLTLTPAEQQAELEYQASTAHLLAIGEEWGQLKEITQRTPEQEKQFHALSDQMDSASKGLHDYYARLYVLFGKGDEANRQLADVKGNVSALEDQISDTPHAAALYTMVTADHYRVLVITGKATVAREYAISSTDLNRKVAEFEEALRDPSEDPRPLGRELYNILIGPVKADLDQAHAETLVWSLDGILRYVPMAALYDGQHYVVETYNTVTITPAFIAHLAEKPDMSNLSAAAMGISRQYENALPALPAVAGELFDVVKDAHVDGANGALPGMILLDGQFTEKAMETALEQNHGVVHIASHFVFEPGDDSQSYLLLAGKETGAAGYHLTVADFRDNRNLDLRHTDLLTLSACDTGMSSAASNGREVDGLGTTALEKGARSVISSLWSVNDTSTGMLMGDFYRRWAEGGGKVSKVEALRRAQLDLLEGKITPGAGASLPDLGPGKTGATAPAGYAHPYYWAPFVLMGNWR